MVSQHAALLKAIESMKLGPEHGALIAYCEGLAEVIDEHPERATLWREYRPAIEMLLASGEVDEEDDGQAALLRLVSTPVGNAKKSRARDAGASGGGGGRKPRAAVDAVAAPGGKRRSRATA